jgi:single stranded DNA-binding protein
MPSQIQMLMYEGYMTEDPVMRFTPGGQAVTNFRMGSNNSYKAKDGTKVDEVTWLKVVCWGQQAEVVNSYGCKGAHVIVRGRLRPGKNGSPEVFQLKNGDSAASFEITADPYGVRILKGKPREDEQDLQEDDYEGLPY